MVSHLAVIALTIASVMSATAAPSQQKAKSSKGPNILTVVVDDLGWSDVGYHDETMHTPTIDGLAKEGVTLSRFYTSPTCTPSRTQFMTGMYNIRIGMQDSVIHATEPRGVPLTAEFLSDKMVDAGYQTAAIGKWHLGMHMPEYLPMSRGFEKHYGIYTGGGSHTKHLSVSQPVYVRGNVGEDIVYTGYNLWEDGAVSSDNFGNTHSTHLYAGKAVEYISSGFDDSKPFFLYLAFQAVHDPMEVGNDAYITDTSCNDISSVGHENSETDFDNRKTLCGMMAEVDDGLNNVVLALKSKGVYENTVIVFFSDNGGVQEHGSLNLPLRGAKADYWEGGVRTPAFLSGGYVQSALKSNGVSPYSYPHLVHLTDLHATIEGLAGAGNKAEKGTMDGKDLFTSFATGGADAGILRNELLININSDMFGGSGALLMKSGDSIYKLIVSPQPAESGIYNTIKKALAEIGKPTSEAMATMTKSALNKELGAVRTTQLFDVSKNEGEREGGDCDDAAECSSLYLNADYADVLAKLQVRWDELEAAAAPTSFSFVDDGPLANPSLFGGFWDSWRVEESGEPRALYTAVTEVVDTAAATTESMLTASSSSPSLSSSTTAAFSGGSSLAAMTTFLAVFGGVVGLVAFRAGKRAMEYMPI
jgi:arylsulfatase A-like enzyme